MGSCRTMWPRATRPDSASLRPASSHRLYRAPGPASGRSGPAAPRPAPPRRAQRQPLPTLPGRSTISGSPPPFPAAVRRAGWKQRRGGGGGGAGTKGPGGGGGGSPVGRALLPDHLLVRRQQLQAVAAEADAGHTAGRTQAERTDARTDGPRREGTRESPPPPPRRLCSVESLASQRPGEGSRPAGGGGRWLRPARPSALGPSAARALPRGRLAPPSWPAPGAPAPLTHRPCVRTRANLLLLSRGPSPPRPKPSPTVFQTLTYRVPSLRYSPSSPAPTIPVPSSPTLL